jgi:hypothetical protein
MPAAGSLRSVEVPPCSAAAKRVVLAASSIAAHIGRRQEPPAKDLFVLSAAVVRAATNDDRLGLEYGLDSAAGLLEQLPDGEAWSGCRGHLNAVIEFAWLLLQASGPGVGVSPDYPARPRTRSEAAS